MGRRREGRAVRQAVNYQPGHTNGRGNAMAMEVGSWKSEARADYINFLTSVWPKWLLQDGIDDRPALMVRLSSRQLVWYAPLGAIGLNYRYSACTCDWTLKIDTGYCQRLCVLPHYDMEPGDVFDQVLHH